MRGREVDVKSYEWTSLNAPEKWFNSKFIKISERGDLIISAGLRRELLKEGEKIEIGIEAANELKLLKIFSTTRNGFIFPKSGRLKFLEFSQMLEQKGYGIPAVYNVEWNEKAGMWIGVLSEIERAPKVLRKKRKQ